jgi:hypothetical protein
MRSGDGASMIGLSGQRLAIAVRQRTIDPPRMTGHFLIVARRLD